MDDPKVVTPKRAPFASARDFIFGTAYQSKTASIQTTVEDFYALLRLNTHKSFGKGTYADIHSACYHSANEIRATFEGDQLDFQALFLEESLSLSQVKRNEGRRGDRQSDGNIGFLRWILR